jgi:predicted PurR-regulated permease PerM
VEFGRNLSFIQNNKSLELLPKNIFFMDAIFAQFNKQLEEEGKVREEIRKIVQELNQTLRKAFATIQQVHSDLKQSIFCVSINVFLQLISSLIVLTFDFWEVNLICSKVKEEAYPKFKMHFVELQKLVNGDNYYRYVPHWKNEIQQIVFLIAFLTWMETRTLVDLSDVETALNSKSSNRHSSICFVLSESSFTQTCSSADV